MSKCLVGAALVLSITAIAPIAHAQRAPANVDWVAPVLHWGTPVALNTVRELSSKTLTIGQRIDLEVADPVSVAGHIVIPRGTPAVGEVAALTRRGDWGRRGRLQIRLLYVRVGDQMVRITGNIGNEGHNGTAGTIATVAALGWVGGFLVTGTSAVIPLGTGLSGYVDEDVPLSFGTAPVGAAIVINPGTPIALPAAYTGNP